MARQPTVAIWELRALAASIAALGGDDAGYLAALGLGRDTLADGDVEARVSHAVACAAWEQAPRFARDENFGLHLAQAWNLGAFDVLEYCMRASPTLGTAIETLLRYQRVMHEAADITLTVDGERARFRRGLRGDLGPAPRHVSEFIFALLVVGGRDATGVAWMPDETRFVHPRPDSTAEHERLFGERLFFGAAADELTFARTILELPMRGADRALGLVLERQANALLSRLPAPTGIAGEVRHRLTDGMRGRVPPVPELAQKLGLSVRSFHRRLAEEGTTYQKLLDGARRDLALAHVREGALPLGEIAFVLGFSDASAFHRAFRRWTGTTPRGYRDEAATRRS